MTARWSELHVEMRPLGNAKALAAQPQARTLRLHRENRPFGHSLKLAHSLLVSCKEMRLN